MLQADHLGKATPIRIMNATAGRDSDHRSGLLVLRNHPSMRYGGAHNWPPVWTQSGCHGNKTARGEFGFLRQVSGDLRSTRRYYLLIDHQGERYMGAMLFDDPVFGRLIAQVLREHLGWPIQQIGGLDLSFTLGRNSGGEEIDLAKAYVLGLNRRR